MKKEKSFKVAFNKGDIIKINEKEKEESFRITFNKGDVVSLEKKEKLGYLTII